MDTINQRDGRTDGQMDTERRQTSRLRIASCGKNSTANDRSVAESENVLPLSAYSAATDDPSTIRVVSENHPQLFPVQPLSRDRARNCMCRALVRVYDRQPAEQQYNNSFSGQTGCMGQAQKQRRLINSRPTTNKLPLRIRETQSLPAFKRHLKTHFFQSAYPTP